MELRRLKVTGFLASLRSCCSVYLRTTGCLKNIVPRLCGYCGRALNSVFSVFTQLYRSSFNLEFETLFETILLVVPDSWQRKGRISDCFKSWRVYSEVSSKHSISSY